MKNNLGIENGSVAFYVILVSLQPLNGLFLYSTTKALRVPEGVELLDARELWPGPVHRFFYPDGDPTPALHANLVRYAALERFGGWYADLDMICLRGLPTSKVYLGWQTDTSVNGAVMKFPANSPVMAGAIEEARARLPQTARVLGMDISGELPKVFLRRPDTRDDHFGSLSSGLERRQSGRLQRRRSRRSVCIQAGQDAAGTPDHGSLLGELFGRR